MGQDINTGAFHLIQRWEGRAGGIPFLITLQVTSRRLMSASDPLNLSEKFLQEKKKITTYQSCRLFPSAKVHSWSCVSGPAFMVLPSSGFWKPEIMAALRSFLRAFRPLSILGCLGVVAQISLCLKTWDMFQLLDWPQFFLHSPLQMLAKF